jgi:hypothetical protein
MPLFNFIRRHNWVEKCPGVAVMIAAADNLFTFYADGCFFSVFLMITCSNFRRRRQPAILRLIIIAQW